jgi:hypothetical protein
MGHCVGRAVHALFRVFDYEARGAFSSPQNEGGVKGMMAQGIVARAKALVGMPFMRLPGNPPDHLVAGETYEGVKLRVEDVEMVWNDAILLDAIHGGGKYRGVAYPMDRAALEIAERLYGVSLAQAVEHWLTLPKVYGSMEWPGEPA